MTPFQTALYGGVLLLSFIIALAQYTQTDLDVTLYILAFVGGFFGVFIIAIVDDDLQTDKQIKKSLDKKNNNKH